MISDDPYSPLPDESSQVTILDRVYTFTVVGAAILALALAFLPAAQSCVVESIWSYARGGETTEAVDEAEVDRIKYAIKGPDAIRSAIKVVSPSIDDRNFAAWERKVAESVAVRVEPDDTGKNVKVSVRAGGNSEVFCTELISVLQEQFHQRYHRPVDTIEISESRKMLESQVVLALKVLDKKQAMLDLYLKKQMEAARQAATNGQNRTSQREVVTSDPVATTTALPDLSFPGMDLTSPSDSTADTTANNMAEPAIDFATNAGSKTDSNIQTNPFATESSTPIGNLPKIEVANPDYVAIEREIATLELQSQTLGSPANDPRARTTARSLQQLRALINETPRSVAIKEDWVSNPYSSDATAGDSEGQALTTNPFVKDEAEIANEKLDEELSDENRAPNDDSDPILLARNDQFDAYAVEQSIRGSANYQKLLRSFEAAKRQHNAALDALASTPNAANMSSQEVEIIEPPKVVSRFRTGLGDSSIWKFLIPSALLGLACAAFSSYLRIPQTYHSSNDAASSLNLPVVGAITTDSGPAIKYPVHAQRPWVKRIRHVAELVLVVGLLAVIYAMATFDGFSDMFARDPFAAFMTAIDHVKKLAFGQG